MKTRILKSFIIFLAVFLVGNTIAKAQWDIPADKKSGKPAIAFNEKTADAGKELYLKNCKSCHGDVGQNNSLPLTPRPPDFASDIFQSRTEGELFYKMTIGRGAMPSFEKQLSEEQRWNIVSYAKSLSKAKESTVAGNLTIKIVAVDKDTTLNAVVTDESGKPAAGIKVNFSAKRIFGNWIFAEKVSTNATGYASAKFPTDLPGDSLGQVKVLVSFSDADRFGKKADTLTVAWGTKFFWKNPLDQRAVWGNRAHTPIWLLITYLSVVIGVWAVILYVVLQIIKLKKLGKK